jgi:hypothetical protein
VVPLPQPAAELAEADDLVSALDALGQDLQVEGLAELDGRPEEDGHLAVVAERGCRGCNPLESRQ